MLQAAPRKQLPKEEIREKEYKDSLLAEIAVFAAHAEVRVKKVARLGFGCSAVGLG